MIGIHVSVSGDTEGSSVGRVPRSIQSYVHPVRVASVLIRVVHVVRIASAVPSIHVKCGFENGSMVQLGLGYDAEQTFLVEFSIEEGIVRP